MQRGKAPKLIGDLRPPARSQQRSWLSRPLPPILAEWWTDLEGEGLALNTRLAYIRDLTDVADYLATREGPDDRDGRGPAPLQPAIDTAQLRA